MIEFTKKEILQKLGAICALTPDVRFGQMIANLAFLAEDTSEQTLWDIEDEDLLRVMERHVADLAEHQPNSA